MPSAVAVKPALPVASVMYSRLLPNGSVTTIVAPLIGAPYRSVRVRTTLSPTVMLDGAESTAIGFPVVGAGVGAGVWVSVSVPVSLAGAKDEGVIELPPFEDELEVELELEAGVES